MKKLYEIAGIVSQKRVKRLQILTKRSSENTRLYELYDGIARGSFSNDSEAALALFGSPVLTDSYRRLKSDLRKRLLNNIFYLDINDPSFGDYHSSVMSCYKHLAMIKILVSNGARNSGLELAKRTLKSAIKYNFNEVTVSLSRILMENASFTGNLEDIDKYSRMAISSSKKLQSELLSEALYFNVIVHYAKSIERKRILAGKAWENYRRLQSLLKRGSPSITLIYNCYRVKLLAYLIDEDYLSALRMCGKLEEFCSGNKTLFEKKVIGRINLFRLYIYIHLEDYNNGEKAALECLTYFGKDGNNYIIFLEYYFLLLLAAGKYQKAYTILREAQSSRQLRLFPEERREKWRIFEAYLRFAAEDNIALFGKKNSFNLSRFLNEVPVYEKDKRGYNVAIIIIHILFLLRQGKTGAIHDREEALRIYCSRWLNHDNYYRSNMFIKMLLLMIKENFSYEKVEKRSRIYYARLAATRFSYRGTPNDLEIIPYENLWQITLGLLKSLPRDTVKNLIPKEA